MFSPNDVVIECDGDWDCCQREQAQAKAKAMNKELGMKPSPTIKASDDMKTLLNFKDRICARSRRQMKKANAAKAAEAKRRGAPPCLVEKIENGDPVTIQMDHPLDVKLGGLAGARLTPLDAAVNNKFGQAAKNQGNRIGIGKSVEKVVLVCPKGGNCPDKDFSA